MRTPRQLAVRWPLLAALLAFNAAGAASAQDLGAVVDEPRAAPTAKTAPAPAAPTPPVSPEAAAAIQETLQLTPDEIRALKAQAAGVSKAMTIPPGLPPRPLTSSVPVKLAPGHAPPTLFLASGMVANATFLDATGAAWPVERWSVSNQGGQAGTFHVTELGVNILSISSARLFAVGNIAIKFKDLDTPVAITLAQGASRVVDYNKEFQLPGRGPLAQADAPAPAIQPEIEPALYDFLDGIPPAGAQAKQLTGANGTVWLYHKAYYLKTTSTLISPAWQHRADASDGTTVYQLAPIPILVLSDRGRERRARVR
jgi:intracellular multiplication protein IcmK